MVFEQYFYNAVVDTCAAFDTFTFICCYHVNSFFFDFFNIIQLEKLFANEYLKINSFFVKDTCFFLKAV